MGMRSRKIRSAKRKAEKRQMKAMRRAQYEAYASQGKRRKRGGGPKGTSAHIDCGNPACKKCFVELHIRLNLRKTPV